MEKPKVWTIAKYTDDIDGYQICDEPIEVVEYAAYEKAIAALKEIRGLDDQHYRFCDKVLKDLGEL